MRPHWLRYNKSWTRCRTNLPSTNAKYIAESVWWTSPKRQSISNKSVSLLSLMGLRNFFCISIVTARDMIGPHFSLARGGHHKRWWWLQGAQMHKWLTSHPRVLRTKYSFLYIYYSFSCTFCIFFEVYVMSSFCKWLKCYCHKQENESRRKEHSTTLVGLSLVPN